MLLAKKSPTDKTTRQIRLKYTRLKNKLTINLPNILLEGSYNFYINTPFISYILKYNAYTASNRATSLKFNIDSKNKCSLFDNSPKVVYLTSLNKYSRQRIVLKHTLIDNNIHVKIPPSYTNGYFIIHSNYINKLYIINDIHKSSGLQTYFKLTNAQLSFIAYSEWEKYEQNIITKKAGLGMKFWRIYWNNLHWLSYNYPNNPSKEDKQQVLDLIAIMQTTGITCSKCRNHFKIYVQKYPDINTVVENKESLFAFFWGCHNEVNKKNKKPLLSLENALAIYQDTNWSDTLNKYGSDILEFFKNRHLKEFPKKFNTITYKLLITEAFT